MPPELIVEKPPKPLVSAVFLNCISFTDPLLGVVLSPFLPL